MIKKLFCNLLCGILICSQILMGSQFCQAQDMSGCPEYLSPKLSISEDSLKHSLEMYSKIRVEDALRKTAKIVTDIAKRNVEREFNPQELVIVLAMLLEGKSLREIDGLIDLGHYLMEDLGLKKAKKKPRSIRIIKNVSITLFALVFAFGYAFLGVFEAFAHIPHYVALPLFFVLIWLVGGWGVDLFYWINKRIDPMYTYKFEDPTQDLSAEERVEFNKHIRQTLSNIIANRFNAKKDHKAYDPESREKDYSLPVVISPERLFNYDIMMSAI